MIIPLKENRLLPIWLKDIQLRGQGSRHSTRFEPFGSSFACANDAIVIGLKVLGLQNKYYFSLIWSAYYVLGASMPINSRPIRWGMKYEMKAKEKHGSGKPVDC